MELVFVLISSCSDIVIQGVTILAPIKSPNTDGIDPGDVSLSARTSSRLIH